VGGEQRGCVCDGGEWAKHVMGSIIRKEWTGRDGRRREKRREEKAMERRRRRRGTMKWAEARKFCLHCMKIVVWSIHQGSLDATRDPLDVRFSGVKEKT